MENMVEVEQKGRATMTPDKEQTMSGEWTDEELAVRLEHAADPMDPEYLTNSDLREAARRLRRGGEVERENVVVHVGAEADQKYVRQAGQALIRRANEMGAYPTPTSEKEREVVLSESEGTAHDALEELRLYAIGEMDGSMGYGRSVELEERIKSALLPADPHTRVEGEECICSEKRTCNFHRGNPSPTEGPTGPSSRSAHALEEHRRNVARLDDRVLVSWLRDLAQSLQRQGRSRYPASALAEEAANRIES